MRIPLCLTVVVFLASAGARAAAPNIAWDSEDPLPLYKETVSEAPPPAPAVGESARQEIQPAAPAEKPELKFENQKLKQLFRDVLLPRTYGAPSRSEVLTNFPVRNSFSAELDSSVTYPVLVLYADTQRRLTMYAFFLLSRTEIELQRHHDPSTERLIGFGVNGLRYWYAQRFHPELMDAFEDELTDQLLTETDTVQLTGVDFEARAAMDYIVQTNFVWHTRSAENDKPWWEEDGLGEEVLEEMTSEYRFTAFRDLDGDGTDELIAYRAKPEELEQRGEFRPDSHFGHKWNHVRIGYEIQDGHGPHADRFHESHGGKDYCVRDLLGGYWHEPFVADYESRIALIRDPAACGLGELRDPRFSRVSSELRRARSALLFDAPEGGSKILLVGGLLRAHPFRMFLIERADVDEQARACLLSTPHEVLSTAAEKL